MIREDYPEIASALSLYCNANNFDLDVFKKQLSNERWRSLNPTFKDDFQKMIEGRLITMKEHVDLTEVDFETDDELFEYLQKIFDHVYHDGPVP